MGWSVIVAFPVHTCFLSGKTEHYMGSEPDKVLKEMNVHTKNDLCSHMDV